MGWMLPTNLPTAESAPGGVVAVLARRRFREGLPEMPRPLFTVLAAGRYELVFLAASFTLGA
jgi:hypothetical protein